MARRAFEDFEPGEVIALGRRAVTRAEIIAFAVEFDPQPFHLDERAVAAGPGGLAGDHPRPAGGMMASGWHTCAIWMRMACEAWLLESTGMGSPGIERLEWRRPVRPGDVLTGRSTVLDKRVSRSRPDMGIVRLRHELHNEAGELVMWMDNPVMFALRAGTAPA